ncbi:MAG: EAL domain-containing protein, partial [Candidatus Dormibacteraeota bacterium]|nr:EAL domain-containing protein [Candidatus Dormibacteraeota bacterium]
VDRPLRLTVQGDLAQAIELGELLLHFQPIVEIWSGNLSGVEALVRWQHPTLGMLAPDRFIPALEESGLIQQLSVWVVRNAIEALRCCREAGLDLVMAANVSARCLVDGRIPELVREELAARQIPPDRLRLELTETAAVTDLSEAALAELRAIGVRFAIDDFGTGHSSLTRLRHLPVAEVKVDRSFVAGLGARAEDEAIVRSTINLAHSLGVEVVAEGVETAEVMERLADMGCDLAQGYLIARPMPLPDVFSWDSARRRTHLAPLREAS